MFGTLLLARTGAVPPDSDDSPKNFLTQHHNCKTLIMLSRTLPRTALKFNARAATTESRQVGYACSLKCVCTTTAIRLFYSFYIVYIAVGAGPEQTNH